MTNKVRQDDKPILAITERALERTLSFRAAATGELEQAMWVEITGTADGEYTYNLTLRPVASARASDIVQRTGGLAVVMLRNDGDRLGGATLDWIGHADAGGLTLVNPNKPPPPAAPVSLPMSGSPAPPASPAMGDRPPADLTGPLEQRVIQVLEQQVNPSIEQHGGRADLVAIEDATAYLRLSGGCQGCGMATVTLSQGIEVSIKEAIPEIEQVVDVTDHAAGGTPYYEAAKK